MITHLMNDGPSMFLRNRSREAVKDLLEAETPFTVQGASPPTPMLSCALPSCHHELSLKLSSINELINLTWLHITTVVLGRTKLRHFLSWSVVKTLKKRMTICFCHTLALSNHFEHSKVIINFPLQFSGTRVLLPMFHKLIHHYM